MLIDDYRKIIESLLFIKGEEGVSTEYLASFMSLNTSEAENILNIFKEEYNETSSALVIKKFGSNYKMLVKDDIFSIIKDRISSQKLSKLSKAALETLAIIAYNQPISKLEIDKIRNVSSDGIINSLLEKELIVSNKVLDKIGKPKLYETTDLFLDIFGIESLEQLPKIDMNIDNI